MNLRNLWGPSLVLLTALVTSCAAGVDPVPEPGGEKLQSALSVEQCEWFAATYGSKKVTICHYIGTGTKKRYQALNVAWVGCQGHKDHDYDYVAHDDPDCSGDGCFPEGAPYDGVVVVDGVVRGECCEGLAPVKGFCAPDGDLDGVGDALDNCAKVANADQADADADGVGDACDNCLKVANTDQADRDADTVGDACDRCPGSPDGEDADLDGVPDGCDQCPDFPDYDEADGDGIPDACDNCADVRNSDQANSDAPIVSTSVDLCAQDRTDCPEWAATFFALDDQHHLFFDGQATIHDGEGITIETLEFAPDTCEKAGRFSAGQWTFGGPLPKFLCVRVQGQPEKNWLLSGFGFADGDDEELVVEEGAPVVIEVPPPPSGDETGTASSWHLLFRVGIDREGDLVGDACDVCPGFSDDADADDDTIPDGCDNCPLVVNPAQEDMDADGIGDACDICAQGPDGVDWDQDGIPDLCDNCFETPNPTQEDADGNGIGDACDVPTLEYALRVDAVKERYVTFGHDLLVSEGLYPLYLFWFAGDACDAANVRSGREVVGDYSTSTSLYFENDPHGIYSAALWFMSEEGWRTASNCVTFETWPWDPPRDLGVVTQATAAPGECFPVTITPSGWTNFMMWMPLNLEARIPGDSPDILDAGFYLGPSCDEAERIFNTRVDAPWLSPGYGTTTVYFKAEGTGNVALTVRNPWYEFPPSTTTVRIAPPKLPLSVYGLEALKGFPSYACIPLVIQMPLGTVGPLDLSLTGLTPKDSFYRDNRCMGTRVSGVTVPEREKRELIFFRFEGNSFPYGFTIKALGTEAFETFRYVVEAPVASSTPWIKIASSSYQLTTVAEGECFSIVLESVTKAEGRVPALADADVQIQFPEGMTFQVFDDPACSRVLYPEVTGTLRFSFERDRVIKILGIKISAEGLPKPTGCVITVEPPSGVLSSLNLWLSADEPPPAPRTLSIVSPPTVLSGQCNQFTLQMSPPVSYAVDYVTLRPIWKEFKDLVEGYYPPPIKLSTFYFNPGDCEADTFGVSTGVTLNVGALKGGMATFWYRTFETGEDQFVVTPQYSTNHSGTNSLWLPILVQSPGGDEGGGVIIDDPVAPPPPDYPPGDDSYEE